MMKRRLVCDKTLNSTLFTNVPSGSGFFFLQSSKHGNNEETKATCVLKLLISHGYFVHLFYNAGVGSDCRLFS